MKKFKKIVLSVLLLGFIAECSLLGIDTYRYTKYKYTNLTLNGRIICEIDNLINFSGMASK